VLAQTGTRTTSLRYSIDELFSLWGWASYTAFSSANILALELGKVSKKPCQRTGWSDRLPYRIYSVSAVWVRRTDFQPVVFFADL
jgi:hypothetical protein